MAHPVKRLTDTIRARPGRTMLVMLAVLMAAVLWKAAVGKPGAADSLAQTEMSAVVAREPFVLGTGFSGEIAPGESIAVVAPFDGVVKRLAFTYGDQVGAGQVLAELSTADVQRARNDAEAAYLKAVGSSADLRDWQSGPEMSRARRGLTSATLELQQTERRMQETKKLLDRGLVPRLEYETLEQQLRSQKMSVEAAEQDLRLTAEQGQGVSRRIAALNLANAADRLASLNADIDGATIVAPDAGIIVLPPASNPGAGATDASVRVGARMTKGQPLGVIARAGGLGVRFQLDESDVNAITPGQAVTVSGAGFPGAVLKGRIQSVAGQATAGGAQGGKASFVATALLDPLAPEQARQVRIGMSANLNVITYSNPSALTVPPQAIQGAGDGAYVLVRDAPRGEPRKVTVRVGKVAPDKVEVLSGLKPGDRVIWTAPAPTGASAAPR